MKIVYLSSPISSQYGGGEKFLDDFTSGIDAQHEFIGSSKAIHDLFLSKGHKPTLTAGLFEPVSPRNLLLFPISMFAGLVQFIRFYKTFKASDWIISPTSHCETFFVIPWIRLFLRKPVLYMVHSNKPPRIFSLFPFNKLISFCWGDSPVAFVSNSQKKLWNSVGINSGNQIVIYNGVQINQYKNEIQTDRRSIKIGFVARLHWEKACDVLIKALKSIKSTHLIEVIIGGDGPEKSNLLALYAVQNLPKNITVSFVGFVSDVKLFYQSLDVLVFPSRYESFGLVIIEAMERGLSVITSDIPSSVEVKNIVNLKTEKELVFELDSIGDLASKIDYFISHQQVYLDVNYKQKLHNLVVEKFDLEKMLIEYRKVLNL